MNKELTLKEAETIVDTMYQNRFVEAGVDEGNTIHLGNLNKLSFTDLESASILLLRTEIRQKREITQLTNNWNELEEWLGESEKICKENDNNIGVNFINIVLDKMKEIKEGK